mmetsp:Transcript_1753/g.5545  ORF Transcript_1753/g.5545 Transcript_1753/m.5545 type:complete len:209 (-) Transcript_1753:302-928(-)
MLVKSFTSENMMVTWRKDALSCMLASSPDAMAWTIGNGMNRPNASKLRVRRSAIPSRARTSWMHEGPWARSSRSLPAHCPTSRSWSCSRRELRRRRGRGTRKVAASRSSSKDAIQASAMALRTSPRLTYPSTRSDLEPKCGSTGTSSGKEDGRSWIALRAFAWWECSEWKPRDARGLACKPSCPRMRTLMSKISPNPPMNAKLTSEIL